MDILDTTTNTWSKGPSMAKRRATQDCIVTEHNGEKGVMVMLKFLSAYSIINLRTDVRGDFNIHGTKNFQDAVFHHKSKIYDFLSILKLLLGFLSPFLIKKKNFEKKF